MYMEKDVIAKHELAKKMFRTNKVEQWQTTEKGQKICLDVSMQISKARDIMRRYNESQLC